MQTSLHTGFMGDPRRRAIRKKEEERFNRWKSQKRLEEDIYSLHSEYLKKIEEMNVPEFYEKSVRQISNYLANNSESEYGDILNHVLGDSEGTVKRYIMKSHINGVLDYLVEQEVVLLSRKQ